MYMLGSNYPNVLKGRVHNKNNNYGLLSQSVCAAHAYIITDVLMERFLQPMSLAISVNHRLYLHSGRNNICSQNKQNRLDLQRGFTLYFVESCKVAC